MIDMQAKDENFTVVSTAALESLKRMVDELELRKNSALSALRTIRQGGATYDMNNRLSDLQMAMIAKSALDFDAMSDGNKICDWQNKMKHE